MKRYIKSSDEYEIGGERFDGYMGGSGWKGRNSDAHLDIKDIAKIVRTQFKNKFPGYKISARISRFSMGCSIDVEVLIPMSDVMPKDQFVSDCVQNPYQYLKDLCVWGRIGAPRADGSWETLYEDELRDLSEEERADFFSRYYDHEIESNTNSAGINAGFEPIPLLNNKAIQYVDDLVKSFNYRDSNAMADYYDTNFYAHIQYGYLG